ncbi:MAG TPA: tetratricopeptide repeat-containing glycosyltransferase family protein [Acetobacteraceae bacterium]|nr:tetratricopeptide repeat-containing glycosyltransferase family protein [Acetobacteraceae bacterium]
MCSYKLTTQFRVDASGRRLSPEPTHGMEAAARFYHTKDYNEAERCCCELIARDPHHFDALHLLGVVHLERGQLTAAIEYLNRAVGERENDAQANYHLGTALLGDRQFAGAEAALRKSLLVRPDDVDTLNNLGNALIDQGRHDEALTCFENVLRQQPEHLPARYNAARALAGLDRLDEAIAGFQAALTDAPDDTNPDRLADIYSGLGQALAEARRFGEATAACGALAAIKPGVAAWNESLILLLRGEFAEGWRKYECRWDVPDHDRLRADARVPTLAEIAGKRVLLVPEQGHGDLIQFCRYAPLLAERGAHVSMQTYVELQALMRTLKGVDAVVNPNEPEPASDIIAPLLSLPNVFGTDITNIPGDVPYLQAPVDRLAVWCERLGTHTGRRIGLAWRGNQHIPKRSMPLAALEQILSARDAEFHSLQKESAGEHPALIDHHEDLRDFSDSAALISLLDLVITIDTSVAHLAGALGKPVWIMLHHAADWRWLLDRDDSPWYPTARLFRQRQPGDWGGVVSDVVRALDAIRQAPVQAQM